MKYTGLMFYPSGAKLTLDLANLSPLQGNTAYELYGQFKHAMADDEFIAKIDVQPPYEPLALRFKRVGQTAAHVSFSQGEQFEPDKLEAAVALLARLDVDEDEIALSELASESVLHIIRPSDWEDARMATGPVAAAFFTTEEALNDPLIHGLMSLAGAAFFDTLGLLD